MTAIAKNTKFPAMLEQFKGEIEKVLPEHLNANRMCRVALTAFRKNKALGNCDPSSVMAAVIQASQLGLEPDTMGRSYLIPYGKECQFIPGWKGLIDLVNRSGNATVWTGAIFKGDKFDFQLGDNPYLTHKPMGGYDPDTITHVYAVGKVKDAERPIIECWPIERVIGHRDRYNKVGKRHYSYENMEMYARKIVLLQVIKYLPMSIELERAVSLNTAAEAGNQGLTVENAIDGTWEYIPDETQQTTVQEPARKSEKKATAKPSPAKKISSDEADMIKAKIMAMKLDPKEFYKQFGIEHVEDLPLERYAGAMNWLNNGGK